MHKNYSNVLKCARLGLRIRIEGLTLFFRNWIAFKSEISLILHIYFSFYQTPIQVQPPLHRVHVAFYGLWITLFIVMSSSFWFKRLVSKLVDQKFSWVRMRSIQPNVYSVNFLFSHSSQIICSHKKVEKTWTWVCSLTILVTSLQAFLSIPYCYYPFCLFIFIYLFLGLNLIFT